MIRTESLGVLLAALLVGCGGGRPSFEGKSVEELKAMLADADPKVQAQGAYGLGQKGREAAAAVPGLVKALASNDAQVRQYAARALGRIGPEARAAVPALAEALRAPPWMVQRQAAVALGEIGPDAKSALPALKKLRDDENRPLREAVREAIKKIGP
jgi:HEAT repeat protein